MARGPCRCGMSHTLTPLYVLAAFTSCWGQVKGKSDRHFTSTSVVYNASGGITRPPPSAGHLSSCYMTVSAPYVKPQFFSQPTYPAKYDWTAEGPFMDMEIAYPSKVEWPNLRTTQVATLWNDDDQSPNFAVFRVPDLPQNWLSISVTFADVLDVSNATAPAPNANPSVLWGSGSQVTDPTSPNSFPNSGVESGLPLMTWNSHFRKDGRSVPNSFLAPVNRAFPQAPYFVYIYLGSCNGVRVSFSAVAAVNSLSGECQSYVDCSTGSSGQSKYSSNGDTSRLRHCGLVDVPGSDSRLNTVTKCMECLPSADSAACECGPNQYCMSDSGLCSSGDAWWTCDPYTHSRYGMCTDKNLNGVIGKPCRANQAQTSGFAKVGSVAQGHDSTQLAVRADGAVDTTKEQGFTGYGFCGELRYYNATGTSAGDVSQVRLGRTVLWSGACVNQRCMECYPQEVPVQSVDGFSACGRVCLNGRVVDPLYVDNTLRTFSDNTVAGTMLAAVMMLILLQLCVCAGVYTTYTTKLAPGQPTPLDRLGARLCPCLRPCCGRSSRSTVFGNLNAPQRTTSKRGTTPLLSGVRQRDAAGRALSSEMVRSPLRPNRQERENRNSMGTSPIVG